MVIEPLLLISLNELDKEESNSKELDLDKLEDELVEVSKRTTDRQDMQLD